MLRHRAHLLLVVVLVLGGSALSALLAIRSQARAADEAAPFEFVLEETTRTNRGGRSSRASLTVYRFAEFDYRDIQFDRLEEFFQDYKEEIGIHHLLMVGFRIVDMDRSGGKTTFVVRVGREDLQRLLKGK